MLLTVPRPVSPTTVWRSQVLGAEALGSGFLVSDTMLCSSRPGKSLNLDLLICDMWMRVVLPSTVVLISSEFTYLKT